MKPKRIILVRHGQSIANLDYGVQSHMPDHLIPLSDLGKTQSLEAGQKLKAITGDESVMFYVSPFLRTRKTLEGIISGGDYKNTKIYESDDLREQEWGHLRLLEESKRIEQERDAYGTYFYRIPDGESGADVCTRVAVFLNTLHRDFEKPEYPQNTIIVSHGLTIRLFCKRWFHWTVEQYEALKNPHNCEIFVMEKKTQIQTTRLIERYELKTPFRTK